MDWGQRAAIVGRFTRRYNGLYVYADGSLGMNPNGAQCVNLANLWCEHLDIEAFPGNAGTFVFDSHPDCEWIANGPRNHPERGAIVVWAEDAAMPFGHVDVCIWATAWQVMGFDQNFPEGSPCHWQLHSYGNVAGWLMPRKLM